MRRAHLCLMENSRIFSHFLVLSLTAAVRILGYVRPHRPVVIFIVDAVVYGVAGRLP